MPRASYLKEPSTVTDFANYVQPAHYNRSDGARTCGHNIPVGPGACAECHSLTDEHWDTGCTCTAPNVPDQTPAQELRAAAERLRWLLHPDGMPEPIRRGWFAPADGLQGRITVPGEEVPVAVALWGGVAEYASAVHPGVGAALAEWLDDEARAHDAAVQAAARVFHDQPGNRAAWVAAQTNDHALAVARELLGAPS